MVLPRMSAISLFTSGGLGDLALRQAGFDILVSNEKLEERHSVFEFNFPSTSVITGDIWQRLDQIEDETRERLDGHCLTLFYATPPCQGMSKNGRGKLLNEIRAGNKPPLDERNRLIIPTMDLARRLQPEIVLLENVPEMADTLIQDENGSLVQILDLVKKQLGPDYSGRDEVVEFADYGVPQRRRRLLTVYSRNQELVDWFTNCETFMPPRSHSCDGRDETKSWVTVRDVLEGLPPLDAKNSESAKSELPYHRVPLLDQMKYWWVKNTPAGRGAFDNQCCCCGFEGNQTHTARHDHTGINRASRETPLYCLKCGEMLPRPSVDRDGVRELMKGFTSAYKRMEPLNKGATRVSDSWYHIPADDRRPEMMNHGSTQEEARWIR